MASISKGNPLKLFTKSAFKVALRCPAALYYYNNHEYANQEAEDPFLQALAEGGFQVGELAKIYCGVQDGCDLAAWKGHDTPLAKTDELMSREKAVIAEAAFRHGDMFVRADIIVKDGTTVKLIEVKAKSWDGDNSGFVVAKRNRGQGHSGRAVLKDGYGEYLYDVAFQKHVVQHALDAKHGAGVFRVEAYLMMADKSAVADVAGMNQMFKIERNAGRSRVQRGGDAMRLADCRHVLRAVNVDDECAHIFAGDLADSAKFLHGMGFGEFVREMCRIYCARERRFEAVSAACFRCPFYATEKDRAKNPLIRDGFDECWKARAGLSDEDLRKPTIDELNGTGKRRGDLIVHRRFLLADVTLGDLMPAPNARKKAAGLGSSERQWVQAALSTGRPGQLGALRANVRDGMYLDVPGLRAEMSGWTFPLHMIDFETSAVALPFYANMHPYEMVAFQFSHHVIDSRDGGRTYAVRHEGQYLNARRGFFPNFEFVRELKAQLEKDGGSIFRYHNHENTVLWQIRRQLLDSGEPDKDELVAFIESIAHGKDDGPDGGELRPARDMIDLCTMVKRYFWHPEMKGSNSIKAVLPAVLNASRLLREKYGRPIYGSEIPSRNIDPAHPVAWISWTDDGPGARKVVNPYKTLPPIASYFPEESRPCVEGASEEDAAEDGGTVANGGAALWAYGMMQFADGTDNDALAKALLRYCELDTMAMVFIWEFFNEKCKN